DWLIEAGQTAARGEHEAALAIIDRAATLAQTHSAAVYATISHPFGETPNFEAMVDTILQPLRQFLYGLSLIREMSLQSRDLVLSFGERLSARLLATLLNARGVAATFVDARSWTVTDDTFGSAIVDWPATQQKLNDLRPYWADCVPVNTGFLGSTPDGRTTTLGRNGSDYTATLLARGLGAEEVIISTDVPGVMTADPALVRDAYPLQRLSYWEALELANFGTKMFHPRTMIPLIESGIPMRIRSTMRPDEDGTRVTVSADQSSERPTSVTSLEQMALLDIIWKRTSGQSQVGERVLRALDRAAIPLSMANQAAHGQSVAVVIRIDRVAEAIRALRDEFALELSRNEIAPVQVTQPVTLLSLVAEAMARTPSVAGRFFGALGSVGINIQAMAQGSSSRSISCVIDAAATPVAVRTVHDAFNFSHQDVNLLILGKGVVGSELLSQIADQRAELRDTHQINLNIVGIANSKKIALHPEGMPPQAWSEALKGSDTANTPDALRAALTHLRHLPVPVLIDCTAADDMEQLYTEAFHAGVHVVGANKKPLCIDRAAQQALMQTARRAHRAYSYETTVGASLPVIDTLKNLVRSGDRVDLIEGSFSGTLGYLTNELMSGVSLSDAIRKAQERGYTEPNPADDLSGLDVARKALILARELELPVSIEDVHVTPLVPQEILDQPDLEAFYDALKTYDTEMNQIISGVQAEGKTLRYLARIEPRSPGGGPKLVVGPMSVDPTHPGAQLRGSESFVAFTTERYATYPLIVRGPGAGGAVTAAGVLTDVLRIAQMLRGR
ncbi:MAG: bifunctional aspartate kinase/homoserine dehydrogenase I, partial [Myxococcota bacterium]